MRTSLDLPVIDQLCDLVKITNVNEAIILSDIGIRYDQARIDTVRAVGTGGNVSNPDDGNWKWIPTQVNFALNSSEFLSSKHDWVDTIGQAMLQDPTLVLAVSGHADALGSDGVNDALSYERAQAVKEYLVRSFGIAEDRLVLRWRGEREPLPGAAPMDPKNRRVQFGKRLAVAAAEERKESDTKAVADLLRLLRDEGNAGN